MTADPDAARCPDRRRRSTPASRGQLVKTHPRVRPGGRSTDPGDYPAGRAEYALRDVATLTAKAAAAGPAVGVSADRLLGLVRTYGPAAVDAACARALELDVVDTHLDRPDARAGP